MGKIKEWYRSIPIWLALFLFMIVALLAASFLSNKVTAVVNELSIGVQIKYITISTTSDATADEDSGIIYSSDSPIEGFITYDFNYDNYSDEDWMRFQTYRFVLQFAPLLIYSVCILAAVLLFYFTKLNVPLKTLKRASDRIAENELDFSLNYSGHDEMAKLCAAFEKMRSALDINNQQMLRMIDERKQLNDAYTHDLRTPIAVLKGYTDMLTKYLPTGKILQEEVLETVKTLSVHVSRLEQFVESMNTVQKLEDVAIQKEQVAAGEFLEHLRESASILCQSSGLSCEFEAPVSAETLYLDPAVVIQVYENLMSNAVRFARSKVIIRCSYVDNTFSISVLDDGNGFSDKALLKADKPYYSGEAQKQEYHFGLGLHICRTLCEKHGGRLQLANAPKGGANITAQFC